MSKDITKEEPTVEEPTVEEPTVEEPTVEAVVPNQNTVQPEATTVKVPGKGKVKPPKAERPKTGKPVKVHKPDALGTVREDM